MKLNIIYFKHNCIGNEANLASILFKGDFVSFHIYNYY